MRTNLDPLTNTAFQRCDLAAGSRTNSQEFERHYKAPRQIQMKSYIFVINNTIINK